MINVLFVCLGNICRSPMAEAIFRHLVEQQGLSNQFHIESVGTSGYHIGEPAHPGTKRVLSQHGITSTSTSQQITRRDIQNADYIVAMDRSNVNGVKQLADGHNLEGRLFRLLEFASNPGTLDVPDPYYENNFEHVYQLVADGCEGLLRHIREEQGL